MTQTAERLVHTPGPWHATAAPSRQSMQAIRAASGEVVAFINRRPNAAANGRLIEQAPALYEALRALVNGYGVDVSGEEFARRLGDAAQLLEGFA